MPSREVAAVARFVSLALADSLSWEHISNFIQPIQLVVACDPISPSVGSDEIIFNQPHQHGRRQD